MEGTHIKQNDHQEALEHFNRHRDFFEHYARGAVNVEPAPPGLNTFAFNLETNTIYLNSLFYRNLDLSDEKTTFLSLHEIEHFEEKLKLLKEFGGQRTFNRYLKNIKDDEAYGLMDNCVADVRENRAVEQKTHKDFREIEKAVYKENLFKETDFTQIPKHIQLPQALLREARVPEETCQVSPEVKKKIDEFKSIQSKGGMNLFNIMTHPDTPMSVRLRLQDKFLWPMVKELREEDMKNQSGEGKNENKGGEGQVGKGKEGKSGSKETKQKGSGKPSKSDKANPNEVFKESYEEAKKRVPNAVPIEKVKEAFENWRKGNKESPLDQADKEYAKKIGVKVEDLKNYRNIAQALDKIRNPETNETVVEELKALISKILARRKRPADKPRYPVEEGEDIIDPAAAVAEVKGGNLNPKVWETTEIKEQMGKKFGEVEITLVCDRSGSMEQGNKLIEEQKAAVLFMEALKEFADLAEEEKINLQKPLEIRSEIYTFQNDSVDARPVKKMSKELGEKERVEVGALLSNAPGGSTPDFVPLQSILKNLNKETETKMEEGELKKIVIVFTDGGSDNASEVQQVLKKMRDKGVVVVGVGITEGGRPVLSTYAPEAQLVETAEKLPIALSDLLKEHLADI